MIVEFVTNVYPYETYFNNIKKGQRFLVLEITHNLNKQRIYYHLLEGSTYDDTIAYVPWDNFKIVCNRLPSNWIFEIYHNRNYFNSSFTPSGWSDKKWKYGFWESCYGEIEEAKKIYEECGKGWIPNPFEE